MKKYYVADLQKKLAIGEEITLLGWLVNRRDHGKTIFLEICDSTGSIQAVVSKNGASGKVFESAKRVPLESSVRIRGVLSEHYQGEELVREVLAHDIATIGEVVKVISPLPRSDFDALDPTLANHLLRNRHLYIRNSKVMAILRFRHTLLGVLQQWFRNNGYVEISAPILTPVPLYDDRTAMSLSFGKERAFLTQCVGFYLEAAVHAFERVYNIGPSFRGEESRSKRHLAEYWHVKAEVAFGDLEDIISIVENLLSHVVARCRREIDDTINILGGEQADIGWETPFPRISYREAVAILNTSGHPMQFGTSLGSAEEELLSVRFESPFWVTGLPRSTEPFPYVISPTDSEVTQTADLIADRGFGELLGVAEKIADLKTLNERMVEKDKGDDPRYEWIRELRQFGCVPHIGFGMGLERLIRWLLNIPHVRDTIPFPRIFRRQIYP